MKNLAERRKHKGLEMLVSLIKNTTADKRFKFEHGEFKINYDHYEPPEMLTDENAERVEKEFQYFDNTISSANLMVKRIVKYSPLPAGEFCTLINRKLKKEGFQRISFITILKFKLQS